MFNRKMQTLLIVPVILGLIILSSLAARAVPSFERQTGMSCSKCHTVFPELTPFGRSFKLGGYTMSKKTEKHSVPLAAMVQASYTEQKGLRNKIDPFDDVPDAKWNMPQQASVFYGGKIIDHLGAFAQLTYDGIENNLFLDNTDIRYVNSVKFRDTNLLYGITVNNNPTVQDVWNTTPAWGYPWASSAVANTPAASAIIDGALAQQVGGIGIYGFWNELIYGEISVYHTNNKGITRPLGAGTTIDTVISGAMPYWRLALQHQWARHSLSVGTMGLLADIYPEGETRGPTDRYIDTGLDAQYQFLGKNHIFSVQSIYIHENQILDATFASQNSANRSNYLNTFRINANYHYKSPIGPIGGTVGYFSTTGRNDTGLYAPEEITGSRTGSPDSDGMIFQLDYLPWEKWKLSIQYTLYNKFNGASSNYDGFDTNASYNNTFYAMVWISF